MRKTTVFLILFLAVFCILPGMVFAQAARGRLSVWAYTDEVEGMINNYFRRANPNITIDYRFIPTDQFERQLDPVLASGRGTPDVFALEAAFVRKYVESGMLLVLTDIYEANRNRLMAYPVEVGTYNGRVYAMSWQATPGAMFYRRSLARKYLGTDDPAVVQTYFADINKFMETAILIRQRSDGSCVTVSAGEDILIPFMQARSNPWVVNGRLVIDPIAEQYLDIAKTMYDNRMEGRVGQWSDGWFDGMRDNLRDQNGRRLEVFSYFLPTWGLHYVLKPNAGNTDGDWAMIQGPVSWRWGGTWLAAWRNTTNAAAARELIRYLTTDDTFMEQYARDSGDLVTNTNVINRIQNRYSESFLGGQNYYEAFARFSQNINGRLAQSTDNVIEPLFREAVTAYVIGEKTKDRALADFRSQVTRQLGIR